MKRFLFVATLGISMFALPPAFGSDGYVTGNVNLRAGPDSSYPRVAMLGAGTSVVIEGCVDGWSWCDVSTNNHRGWVAGSFLQEEYQGRRVLIPEYGVQIGIPVVSFVFGTYWDNNYRNRSWYGHRERWSHIRPQYRPIASHGNWRDNRHDNSESHSSYGPRHRTGDESRRSRQPDVATARPSYPNRPMKSVTTRQPVAAQSRPAERYAHRAKPAARDGAGSRASAPRAAVAHRAPQPRIAAEHKAAETSAARKQRPEKPAPEKKDDNGKDRR